MGNNLDNRLERLEEYNSIIENGVGVEELKELRVKVKKVRYKDYSSAEDPHLELQIYALKTTLLECIDEMLEAEDE